MYRFFAKVVEVIARCFVKLDLTIETFGFLSVIGIKIKLKNNNIIVSKRLVFTSDTSRCKHKYKHTSTQEKQNLCFLALAFALVLLLFIVRTWTSLELHLLALACIAIEYQT